MRFLFRGGKMWKHSMPFRMMNLFRSSLSRFVLPMLVALVLLAPAFAAADTITMFRVSGTASPTPPLTGTTFSSTLTVDVTKGAATATDVTFPGLSALDTLTGQSPMGPTYFIVADNSSGSLQYFFIPSPTPSSLVGFTGSTLVGGDVGNLTT
jgi:hypothetical protein